MKKAKHFYSCAKERLRAFCFNVGSERKEMGGGKKWGVGAAKYLDVNIGYLSPEDIALLDKHPLANYKILYFDKNETLTLFSRYGNGYIIGVPMGAEEFRYSYKEELLFHGFSRDGLVAILELAADNDIDLVRIDDFGSMGYEKAGLVFHGKRTEPANQPDSRPAA
jgi:hypothetical protein